MTDSSIESFAIKSVKGKLKWIGRPENGRGIVFYIVKEIGFEEAVKMLGNDEYQIPCNKELIKQVNHEENSEFETTLIRALKPAVEKGKIRYENLQD